MEVKFAELLNEHGVTAEQTTTKIRDLKNVFDEAWETYQGMLEDYQKCTDVTEKEALMEEVNEFEADLQQADDEIVKKINEWVKNKDKWEENRRKMAEGRARKAAQANAQQTPPPEPIATNSSQTIPISGTTTHTTFSTSESTPIVNANGGEVVEEESSNTGWWLLAGFVAVVTLGAVVMKRR